MEPGEGSVNGDAITSYTSPCLKRRERKPSAKRSPIQRLALVVVKRNIRYWKHEPEDWTLHARKQHESEL